MLFALHSLSLAKQLTKAYHYDKRGNVTQVEENGNLTATYTYDTTNMMTATFAQGKGMAEYTYDGLLNRVKKQEYIHNSQKTTSADIHDPTSEINYILDMTLPYNNLLMTQGTYNQRFTWGNSLLSGSNININTPSTSIDPITTDQDSHTTLYYLQDHLGSPIRLLGDNICDKVAKYDEFGVQEISQCQPTYSHGFNNPFGFTGYHSDDISGLYYAQARFYSPATGRFGAEDPIRDHTNWYGYCDNNPVNAVDPSGLAANSTMVTNGVAYSRNDDCHPQIRSFNVMQTTPLSIVGASLGSSVPFLIPIPDGRGRDITDIWWIPGPPDPALARAIDFLFESFTQSVIDVITSPLRLGQWAWEAIRPETFNYLSNLSFGENLSYSDASLASLELRDFALDEIRTWSSSRRNAVTTVAAGVDMLTGVPAVGVKVSGFPGHRNLCVEDLVVAQLIAGGASLENIVMTPAIRPRTMEVVPVCRVCQGKYSQSNFVPGTPYEPGGPWGS